jgi:hypothetical protein
VIFLVEFLSDGGELAQLELGEAQSAPALGGADEGACGATIRMRMRRRGG